jgi:hypothetical protein
MSNADPQSAVDLDATPKALGIETQLTQGTLAKSREPWALIPNTFGVKKKQKA